VKRRLPPAGSALDKREVEMAKQLVAMLEGEFNAGVLRTSIASALREFIEAKAAGEAEAESGEVKKAGVVNGALQASLAAMKGKPLPDEEKIAKSKDAPTILSARSVSAS